MDDEAIRRSGKRRLNRPDASPISADPHRVGAPTLGTATPRVAWEALRQGM